ncbi:Ig-like domain-containing protein [Pseudomonas sp. NFACC56-3]|uniref:Ig-like domain-containing protein n=1 Tax=Pseudomonas sp. NFACC56-3 TaxID=1566217 RepID=UPI000871322E|nr:Ig-like domain-containing protein [Pseudomonas sp. NFACC56-3]SCW95196.1 Ig-like domain (group 2) [Pseudomonas sp. NFACC56-3]
MDIQSSTLDELFVLYPVIIPGWVTPVKPTELADGGIPKSLYDDQPRGLECLIDPLVEMQRHAWALEAWDRVDLYVNDDTTPVAGDTVQPGEEQNRMRLHIPHGRLIDGVNRLHYIVTRPSDNSSRPSRDLFVLYHLRAPGDPAPEGLDLLIPSDVVRDGVSAERAAQGVEFGFDYTHRRDYDQIRFLLGNATVEWEITDSSIPVVKTLFTDTFQQAGDNPNTLAEFVVFDQLGNFNRSPTKRLDIHLNSVLTPPALDSVKDADDEEISDGGRTTSTTLKLSGHAHKGKEIEVYDGSGASAVPMGRATADTTTGEWTKEIIVQVGPHRLYAKSLYHSTNVYSNVRTLTTVRPLSIDQSEMKLNRLNYYNAPWPRRQPEVIDNEQRLASDGIPPYTYTSSNPDVATVNIGTGIVQGLRNGTSTITVTDSDGQTASYDVRVSRKYEIVVNGGPLNAIQAYDWLLSINFIYDADYEFAYHNIADVFQVPANWTNLWLGSSAIGRATYYRYLEIQLKRTNAVIDPYRSDVTQALGFRS